MTRFDVALYNRWQSRCFDRTRNIPSETDLAARLEAALDRIEAATAARTATATTTEARLTTLKAAAAEAVSALDTLIEAS